jgi:hypothetical protein
MGPQTPSAPLPFFAIEHAWQRPLHAVAQQTPSTQKPEEHWLDVEQGPPLPEATPHTPPLQVYPAAQSALVAQVVLHALPLHAYGVQSMPPPCGTHVPAPLQACVFRTVPWHVGIPHIVPSAQSWQAPAPSQKPSVPHVDWACAEHSLSGSVPAVMGPQVPSAPPPFLAIEHAWQRPVHAVAQQTPSTQKPDWHCADVEQGLPSPDCVVQTPPAQTYPGAQSAAVMHEVSHALPLHA